MKPSWLGWGLAVLAAAVLAAGCTAPSKPANETLELATLTESGVTVALFLEQSGGERFFLAATFTPEAGYHLYGKDLPAEGVDGLGRPTRLALPAGARLQALGELTESVQQLLAAEGETQLLIYPDGPVTLRLPVALPDGADWVEDQVAVTYMACRESRCRAPVVDRLITVRVPGRAVLK